MLCRRFLRTVPGMILLVIHTNALALAYHPFGSKKWDVQIVATAGEVFDDNITYAENNEKADFITELQPGLKAVYEDRTQYLDLWAASTQQIFARNTDFSNNAQEADLAYRVDLSERDRVRITDQFDHYEEARSFEDNFGRTAGRYSHVRNRFDLDYTHDYNERYAARIYYGNEFDFLSRSGLRDSLVNRAGIEGLWNPGALTTYSLTYDFTHRYVTDADLSPSGSAQIHTLTLDGKHYFTKTLYAKASAGAAIVHDFSDDVLLRPHLKAALFSHVNDRTELNLLTVEWRSRTTAFQKSVIDTVQISGGIKQQIRKRMSGELAGFYAHGEYRSLDFDDDLLGLRAALEYEMREDLKLTGGYRWTLLESSQAAREYLKNEVTAKIQWTFG